MLIFRSLCKEVYGTLLAATVILLLIFITNQLVHYLNSAASGRIGITAVLGVLALQVPLLLSYLLPIALFISVLVVLGRWGTDHEMMAMEACGLTRFRCLRMALTIALVVAALVAWLMLYVEPKVQWYRTTILERSIAKASIQKILSDEFQAFGRDGWTLYAHKPNQSQQVLAPIFLARPEQQNKNWDVLIAQHATEVQNPQTRDHFMKFSHGSRYVGMPGQNDFKVVHFNQYLSRLHATPVKSPDDVKYQPTSELLTSAQHSANANAELQWRLAIPISTIISIIIAVALSEVKPRHGRFAALIPAIIIYIAYADLMILGRSWIASDSMLGAYSLWVIHGIMLLVALALLARYLQFNRYLRNWSN